MLRIVLLVVFSAVAVGCQPKAIREDRAGRLSVSGTLTDGGQPLEVEGRDLGLGMVQIQFLELDESGQLVDNDPEAETTVDKSGAFVVAAGGLLPAQYRVAVYQFDPYPGTDRLNGRFGKDNSPIVQEVAGDTVMEIDLATYK